MAPSMATEATNKALAKPAADTSETDADVDAASNISALVAQQARETLYVLFAWRCVNAFFCRTFFQPDEYFQALEPAWQMVFGADSGAWLTWEWTYGLRSSLHPAIFAIGYAIVDSSVGELYSVKAKWLVAVPRIMQAGFAALGDWYSWRLAGNLFGHSTPISWSVLVMVMLNPWHWYTGTRTFSNCLEATLTITALFYWPWELLGVQKSPGAASEKAEAAPLTTSKQVNSLRLSLFLAAIAVLLRPTNAQLWLAIGTLMLTHATLEGDSPLTQRNLLIIAREAIISGSAAAGLALLADRAYFGQWTFTALNLIHFNINQDLASFYGQNDWHYYLSQGIPLLCTTFVPFVLQGLWKSTSSSGNDEAAWPVTTRNALKALSYAALTNIASMSLISHKEVRFITPLMPLFHVIAAPHISYFFTNAKAIATICPPPKLSWRRRPIIAVMVLVNVVIGVYLSWFHAAGPNTVMTFLRNEFQEIHHASLDINMDKRMPNKPIVASDDTDIESKPAAPKDEDLEVFALFLTPCHATPWRSHLVHPKLIAKGLTCDPPVHTKPGSPERTAYQDETSRFYADPAAYFDNELWPSSRTTAAGKTASMPRYIVAYEHLEPTLLNYFDPASGAGARHNVTLSKVFSQWNGLFTDDDRKSGHMIVWDTGALEEADRVRKIKDDSEFKEKMKKRDEVIQRLRKEGKPV